MKTEKAFSLIEVLAGLFILSLIVIYMLPGFYNTNKIRKKMLADDDLLSRTIDIIENRKSQNDAPVSENFEENGIQVQQTVTDYGSFIQLHIRTSNGTKEYEFTTLIKK